jgi:hypothetical protein
MTINSGSDSYLTSTEFLRYYDTRMVAELLGDTGRAVQDVLDDSKLDQLLRSASGEVEAAALRGGRYTADDLTTISGGTTNGSYYLKKMVAGVVMQNLRARRGRVGEDLLEQFKWLVNALKELRNGEQILGFTEVQEAGNITTQLDNSATVIARRGLALFASPYFGTRGSDRR